MNALDVLGRTLADSNDRESWLAVHDDVIGSSTAGKFAKAASVETYIRQIIEPKAFRGNSATASGNRWEPMLLAWAGAEPNSLFVHHPDDRQRAATIDGTDRVGDDWVIVETKAKHNLVITEPTAYELRQMAWQLYCIPEAIEARFVWGELVRKGDLDMWQLRRDPKTLVYPRDHPQIIAAQALIVPIATEVLAGLAAVRAIEGALA